MISIIMPTLWKGEHYKKMLPQLDSHPLVGEIIVVDNDTTSTDQQIFNLKKLKYLPQKENVYVNPAWNLAVLEATCDSICLYSDDVLFLKMAYLHSQVIVYLYLRIKFILLSGSKRI